MTTLPRHILIVRLGAIGDVVHALPVLNSLRERLPAARISWVVEALSAPIIEGHPQLSHIWVLPWRKKSKSGDYAKAVWRAAREMRRERVDVAIDLQGLTKSAALARLSGASRRIGFAGEDGRELSKFLNNVRIAPDLGDTHVVRKNLALLRALDIDPPAEAKFVFPDFAEAAQRMSGWWTERFAPGDRVAFFNPGAGWETKRMPVPAMGEVAARLAARDGWKIVTLWGPRERDMAEEISRIVANAAGESSAHIAPETNLKEMVEFTRRAGLFIGGDTGPTQIAAALGVPTLSLFGGSDSRRNAPFGPRAGTLQDFSIPCVPCWKMKCPLPGDQRLMCLSALTPDKIMERLKAIIEL